jgi:hypothetical protein
LLATHSEFASQINRANKTREANITLQYKHDINGKQQAANKQHHNMFGNTHTRSFEHNSTTDGFTSRIVLRDPSAVRE